MAPGEWYPLWLDRSLVDLEVQQRPIRNRNHLPGVLGLKMQSRKIIPTDTKQGQSIHLFVGFDQCLQNGGELKPVGSEGTEKLAMKAVADRGPEVL